MQLNCYDKLITGQSLDVKEITFAIKTLKKILSKGGVVVVADKNSLITTYNLDSYKRKIASR